MADLDAAERARIQHLENLLRRVMRCDKNASILNGARDLRRDITAALLSDAEMASVPMERRQGNRVSWLRRLLCEHEYSLAKLERDPDGKVSCPCEKCGKVARAEYGLQITARRGRWVP